MRGLDVVLGALVVSTIGLAVAFPLVYLTTCGPNKKEFYDEDNTPAHLKKIVWDDDDISKPNGCNVCPGADQVPVWIAPGDVCKLPSYGPDVFEHCDLNDEHDYENDYAVEHHFKDCLGKEQLDYLWSTGHCHSNVTGLPFLAEDGMLFCASWEYTPSIIPDAAIDVALPRAITPRGQRGDGRPGAHRRHLADVKTIHAGSVHYYSAHARDEQSGAVRHREAQVWPGYLSHARQLDREYSPAGTTPIEDRLRYFTRTRGLVFGAYGEASTDVHTLLDIAADEMAEQQWRLAGARSATEMRSFIVSRLRRRMGMATVIAMARHRLARVPYIGVPRAVVAARQRREAAQPYAPAPDHADYFAFQARHVAAAA